MPAKPVRDLPGVVPIWQQDVHSSADLRNMFGFADGIAHPAVEGSGIPGTNPYEEPLKAGEFVLGYEDEIHSISQIPQPEVLRRNGTYAVFRKLHTRVAAFRQHLRQRAKNRSEEEWLASKIVGAGPVVHPGTGPRQRRSWTRCRPRNATTPSCSATTRVASSRPLAHMSDV